jgi:hypothetical protein
VWYHGLPARRKCTAPRINLTFRSIVKKPWTSDAASKTA